MSGYDHHMNKSGHARGNRAHKRVTKIEAYFEEVHRPRVIEYKHPSSPVKVEPSIHNYGRPREVDELLTKILTEVNGPPTRTTTDTESGTNWGRRVPHVQVETIGEYGAQPRYGSSKYEVPSYQRARPSDNVYDQVPHRDYDYPDNQRGILSYPDYDHPPQREYYHVPLKTEIPKYDGPPYKGWGSPTKKAQALGNYSVPDRQWNRSSSPKSDYDHHSDKQSPTELQSLKEYGVPKNKWGNPPMNSQKWRDYGDPEFTEMEGQTHRDYGTLCPKYDGPPYKGWGSPAKKALSLGNYGVPDKHWNRSSSPESDYDHHSDYQSPAKLESPKEYGLPKDKWGNPPMNSQKWRDYGDPDYPRDRPSNLVYDHPPNNQAPMKSRDYGTPSNPWSKSSSPVCQDGVCTLNDKPKVTHGPYDEPKGDGYNYPVSKATGYYDDQHRSNPYSHDHHRPEKDHKSPNWMKPSGYNSNHTSTPLGRVTDNIGEALGQLTVAAGASPEGAAGPRAGFSSPAHQGPRMEALRDSASIDSREGAMGYGGHSVPLRPYTGGEDENRTIASNYAVKKYNGSVVPK